MTHTDSEGRNPRLALITLLLTGADVYEDALAETDISPVLAATYVTLVRRRFDSEISEYLFDVVSQWVTQNWVVLEEAGLRWQVEAVILAPLRGQSWLSGLAPETVVRVQRSLILLLRSQVLHDEDVNVAIRDVLDLAREIDASTESLKRL